MCSPIAPWSAVSRSASASDCSRASNRSIRTCCAASTRSKIRPQEQRAGRHRACRTAGRRHSLWISVRSNPSVGGGDGAPDPVHRARATPADACLSQRGGSARGNAILLGRTRGGQSGGQSQAARPRWRIALPCQSGRRARAHRRVHRGSVPQALGHHRSLGYPAQTVRRIARSGSWNRSAGT